MTRSTPITTANKDACSTSSEDTCSSDFYKFTGIFHDFKPQKFSHSLRDNSSSNSDENYRKLEIKEIAREFGDFISKKFNYSSKLENDTVSMRLSTPQIISENNLEDFEKLFRFGKYCLLLFVQDSFTGPKISLNDYIFFKLLTNQHNIDSIGQESNQDQHNLDSIGQESNQDEKWFNEYFRDLMAIDGEALYTLTPHTIVLFLATRIIAFLQDSLELLQNDFKAELALWNSRAVFVWQRVLLSQSATLYARYFKHMEMAMEMAINTKLELKVTAELFLERGTVFHWYQQDKAARQDFISAQKASGLVWKVTGIMGKRTKFQTFETAQLAVLAKSHFDCQSQQVTRTAEPITLELDDDTLLEKVQYTLNDPTQNNPNQSDPDQNNPIQSNLDQNNKELLEGNLWPLDQALLLAFCLNVKNTNPDDGLTTEEMKPFVSRVLHNSNNWQITTMALLLKTRLERNKPRTIERACLQLQELVNQWTHSNKDATAFERSQFFFILSVPPRWELERELAAMFVSIGVVKSALLIYQKLEMWENVISCHQLLEQPKKAENVIQAQLDLKVTPLLLCLMGDVKGDKQFYQQAWELSGCRFARAQRSLGSYYFTHKQWTDAIDCYGKALEINPIFENSWFILGCAAIHAGEYSKGEKAFAKCTILDPGNSEAWNNLASCHIKLNNKTRAHACLKQALKLNYEASNIWENYLLVCCGVHDWGEALRAVKRVFVIRGGTTMSTGVKNAIDYQVLSLITREIMLNKIDYNGVQSAVHAPRLKSLLEMLTQSSSSSKLYALASVFYESQGAFAEMLEFSLKTYRAVSADSNLQTDILVFRDLVEVTRELLACYEKCRGKVEKDQLVCKDVAYQSKMVIKSVLGKTRANFSDTHEWKELDEILQQLLTVT